MAPSGLSKSAGGLVEDDSYEYGDGVEDEAELDCEDEEEEDPLASTAPIPSSSPVVTSPQQNAAVPVQAGISTTAGSPITPTSKPLSSVPIVNGEAGNESCGGVSYAAGSDTLHVALG